MTDSSPPCETEFVERLGELLASHYESLLPLLVNEFQSLRADNEELKQKLLACGRGLTGESDGCVSPRCASSPNGKMETYGFMAPASESSSLKIVPFDSLLEDPNGLDQLLRNSNSQSLPASKASSRPTDADCAGTAVNPKNVQGTIRTADETLVPSDSNNAMESPNEKQAARRVSEKPREESFLFLSQADVQHIHDSFRSATCVNLAKELATTHSPSPFDCARRFIFSNTFECISGIIIMLNAIFMAMKLQYAGFDHENKLYSPSRGRPAPEVWPWAEDLFENSDYVFNMLFIIELALRVWAMRRAALTSRWIWYDSIIITLGLIDLLSSGGVGIHPGMMRIVRILRTVRLLKVFRAMSGFDSLILLIKSLQASRQAAIWSFLVLGLVQMVAGLFICQYVQDYLTDDSISPDNLKEIYRFYGSFSRTLLTTYEVTFGNWSQSCRVLMEHVSEWFSLFYIAYRCLFLFAVLKVIAAVFITETNRVLDHDDELTIIKTNRDLSLFHRSYKKLVGRVDKDNDGMLSWTELEDLLRDQRMKDILPTIGFDKNDLMKLFWLIEDGGGEVSVDDFFAKLCKLKGPAKKVNEMTTLKLVHKIHQMMVDVWGKQGLVARDEHEDEAEEQAVET